jgi:hypothetical protein
LAAALVVDKSLVVEVREVSQAQQVLLYLNFKDKK